MADQKEPEFQMKRVFSSHISEVGYDATNMLLKVVFQTGKAAIYYDVPPDIGYSVYDAPSVGEALHNSVRDKYSFRYV